jgi:hypothetical protein
VLQKQRKKTQPEKLKYWIWMDLFVVPEDGEEARSSLNSFDLIQWCCH